MFGVTSPNYGVIEGAIEDAQAFGRRSGTPINHGDRGCPKLLSLRRIVGVLVRARSRPVSSFASSFAGE